MRSPTGLIPTPSPCNSLRISALAGVRAGGLSVSGELSSVNGLVKRAKISSRTFEQDSQDKTHWSPAFLIACLNATAKSSASLGLIGPDEAILLLSPPAADPAPINPAPDF